MTFERQIFTYKRYFLDFYEGLFSFFDEGNLIIVGNGFQKKTQKTPRQEIERALKIKAEYENEK